MEIKEQQKPSYEDLSRRVRELEERLRIMGNTEYKSRLFSFLFGREENKEWTLSLYT